MPLDKILLKHLDEQDVLEEKIENEIETMILSLNISELVGNAEEILLGLVETVQQRLKTAYYQKSAENGIKLSEDIVKDGDIIVQKTNDPNLNDGTVQRKNEGAA